ncbi:condensation domain-containing protein, partial [Pseudoalteromonas holothuriae]
SEVLSQALTSSLKALAQQHGMTLFMLLHGALGLVLARHSNHHDIVLGTPVANRTHAELAPLIGFFVNTLVLRVDTRHAHLSDYLAHVKEVNLAAQSNQDMPFEQLVEICDVPRNTAHNPLFQIMFSMDTNEHSELALDGVSFTPIEAQVVSTKFDIEINAVEENAEITVNWVYDT